MMEPRSNSKMCLMVLIPFLPPKEKGKQTEASYLTHSPQKQAVFKQHPVNDIKR